MATRSPLQQSLHTIGTEFRRIANDPNPFDGPLCPPPDGVAPRDSGPPYDDGHGHLLREGIRFNRYIGAGHPVLIDAGLDAPPNHDQRVDKRKLAEYAWRGVGEVVPEELRNELQATLSPVTNQEIADALAQTWAAGLRPEFYDSQGDAPDEDVFLKVLPLLTSRLARYVTPENTHFPRGCECRNYADKMKSDLVALGVTACAKTLDYAGHHSFNAVCVKRKVKDPNGAVKKVKVVRILEPQANCYVNRAYPDHGYTGHGASDWY